MATLAGRGRDRGKGSARPERGLKVKDRDPMATDRGRMDPERQNDFVRAGQVGAAARSSYLVKIFRSRMTSRLLIGSTSLKSAGISNRCGAGSKRVMLVRRYVVSPNRGSD